MSRPSPEQLDEDLPAKIANQGTICTVDKANVLLNGYALALNHATRHVYQFELKFISEKHVRRSGQHQPEVIQQYELAKGPRNDESKETRRRLQYALFEQLISQEQAFFKSEKCNFVYDCALLMYSCVNLGMKTGESRSFVLNVDQNALEDRCSAYIHGMERCTVSLMRTDVVIDLQHAEDAYAREDHSIKQFLELLSSQKMFEQRQHYCFGNRFYEQESKLPMRDVVPILKKGLQKNVRFVGDSVKDAQPIIQIDPKKSAFFPNLCVVDYLYKCLGGYKDAGDFEYGFWQHERTFQQANKHIKGVIVQTTHLQKGQITFANMGLTSQSAKDITFDWKGDNVSVMEYFMRAHSYRIRHPKLPCLIKRTPKDESYFPMEVVKICEGQRIPLDKQTPKLTEQMIRECQVLPADLSSQIEGQRNAAFVNNANPFFRAKNVLIKSELLKAKADLLFPPAIKYSNNDSVEPNQRGDLDWKMVGRDVNVNRAYLKSAEWPKRWSIVIVHNCVAQYVATKFIQRFTETARQRGLAASTERPVEVLWDHWPETNIESVEPKFKYLADNKCPFVLIFAESKRSSKAQQGDIHHVIKLMEQKYKVISQHIGPEMAIKASEGPLGGAKMVIENILLKTNLKLGGINWALVTPLVYKNISHNRQDIIADIWFGKQRMFFGLDWSHAPPQSLYERKKGQMPTIPTIVGMAFTIGKQQVLEMGGTYWYQQPRQATISAEYKAPFIANIKDALIRYEQKNGHFPQHLVIFRGGASEGEFKRVAAWEGSAFSEAFKEICNERAHNNYAEPAVTVIVCQRQSNYRIIPENIDRRAKAPQQNVRPGTVVDRGVMSAVLTEFLLVAHKALQGTAQPIRCTVVLEHRPILGPATKIPRIPLEELENITNALCYAHGICCMPTALPGPLFEAGELAKRGRNNWNTSTNGGELIPQHAFPMQDSEEAMNKERADYFAKKSDQLKPNFSTKFWA